MDTKIKITPDMVKSFKTLTCTCGGQLFQTAVVIKKISALVSPTGQEVDYPIEVLVCMNCNKVPRTSEDPTTKMVPDLVLSAPKNTFTLKNDGKSPLSIVRDEK